MKTILLADDSITIQKVVELTFSDGDYRVFCVSNGAQALRKMPEVRPDIVLLDVMMPEKNGYEVCEAMRADPGTASIPVLLLTGTFEPFDRRRAEAAGARGHITKPFESHTLVSRVEELLAQAAAAPIAPPPAHPVSEEPLSAPAAVAARPMAAAVEIEARDPGAMPVGAPPVDAPPPGPHPAFAAPDAASGGAYLGFADLAVGEGDDEIIPDRYEGVGLTSEASVPDEHRPVVTSAGAAASSEESQPPGMEGYMSGYEMPPDSGAGSFRPRDREEALGTPPPAAALSGSPDPITSVPTLSLGRGSEGQAATAGDLSEAALDRLAEIVVRKMSERVVREIAWEVLPGVAETVVRERIKELEDQDR